MLKLKKSKLQLILFGAIFFTVFLHLGSSCDSVFHPRLQINTSILTLFTPALNYNPTVMRELYFALVFLLVRSEKNKVPGKQSPHFRNN